MPTACCTPAHPRRWRKLSSNTAAAGCNHLAVALPQHYALKHHTILDNVFFKSCIFRPGLLQKRHDNRRGGAACQKGHRLHAVFPARLRSGADT